MGFLPARLHFQSNAQFQREVKVGDYLYGYSTGKKVTVTAIGEERFLYLHEYIKGEKVAKILSVTANWRPTP